MTKFHVPDRHVGALKYLASVDATGFEGLLSALSNEPASSRAQLETRVGQVLPASDVGFKTPLVGAILSLCVVRSSNEAKPDGFATELAAAEELEFNAEERKTFEERLMQVLSLGPLTNLAKAANLIAENANLFGEARVITDIRPVFADDPATTPTGAVIMHTLKVDYYSDEDFRADFFVLDDVDLVKLRKAIDRAIEKSESLQALLSSAGLAAMQPMREEE